MQATKDEKKRKRTIKLDSGPSGAGGDVKTESKKLKVVLNFKVCQDLPSHQKLTKRSFTTLFDSVGGESLHQKYSLIKA